MPEVTLLTNVKLALRKTTTAFDSEIQGLIDDCLSELSMFGIYDESLADDPQIVTTVIFYCKANFGSNDESEKWQLRYKEKLEKLQIARGYGGGLIGQNNSD